MQRSKWAKLNDPEIKEFLEYLGVPLFPPITRVEIIMDIHDVVKVKTWRMLTLASLNTGIKYKSTKKIKNQ
jgi:hypothetical protein